MSKEASVDYFIFGYLFIYLFIDAFSVTQAL